MADPMKPMVEIQNAWFSAMSSAAQSMLKMYSHFLEMQTKFMANAAAHHRDHVEIARGPALTDKYGKRAHDIDPEHDV
jgi:hypothetical protein